MAQDQTNAPDTLEPTGDDQNSLFDKLASEHLLTGPAEGEPQGKPAAKQARTQELQADTTPADDKTQSNDDPEAKDDDSEAKEYESLDELLQDKGIDPESAQDLKVKVKIDGEERAVSLKDVVKSFQLEGHVNNKSIELSNQRAALEQEANAVRTAFAQQVQNLRVLNDLAQQQLNNDFARVDWAQLRVTNPAEFAALTAEYQARQSAVQEHLRMTNEQQQQMQQMQQQQLAQKAALEHQALLSRFPEWKDPAKAQAASQNIVQYARTLGFTDADLSQIYDHRIMAVLHDAASYRQLQAKQGTALQKVRQAPTAAKAGPRGTTANPNTVARQRALERMQRNPSDVDAQAAYLEAVAGIG